MKGTCSVLGFVVLSVSRCYSNADVNAKLWRRCLFAWQDELNAPFHAGQRSADRGQERHTTPEQESEAQKKNTKKDTASSHQA